MGYTHYIDQKGDCPQHVWDQLVTAFPKLVELSGVPIGDWEGKPGSVPEVTNDEIRFNGIEPDDYETMILKRQRAAWSCCKTAENPYDVVVTALLCLANTWAPGVWEIRSDGRAGEWKAGVALARQIDPKAIGPFESEEADEA